MKWMKTRIVIVLSVAFLAIAGLFCLFLALPSPSIPIMKWAAFVVLSIQITFIAFAVIWVSSILRD